MPVQDLATLMPVPVPAAAMIVATGAALLSDEEGAVQEVSGVQEAEDSGVHDDEESTCHEFASADDEEGSADEEGAG